MGRKEEKRKTLIGILLALFQEREQKRKDSDRNVKHRVLIYKENYT